MGLTVDTRDFRAAYLMDGAVSWQQPSGPDANSTNGAQTIAVLADRESTILFRVVRGTAGTTNLVIKDADGVDWFITVNTSGTLASSSTVVA